MRWKTLPVNRLIPALLVLLLSCAPLGAWAQEKAEPEQDTGSSTTEPTTPATTPATTSSAEQPAPGNNNDNSPFDYQASEEISQDLSVSFPVDI
jgi:hypothetical protein